MTDAEKRKREAEIAKQKELEAEAAADAEKRKANGGVIKITLEDQAKYAAEHSPKKKADGGSSAGGAAAAGFSASEKRSAAGAGEYDPRFGESGQKNTARKQYVAATIDKLRQEYAAASAGAGEYDPRFGESGQKNTARKQYVAATIDKLRQEYAAENAFDPRFGESGQENAARKQEAAAKAFAEEQFFEKVRENVTKANSSALDKARNSKLTKAGSAEEFYKNRSDAMGRAAIGDREILEQIKNRDLKAELKLEAQKLKYQWEEAGRRYDALSDEEKQALYRRRNSSALDRARMVAEEGGLRGRTAQEARTNISNDIYNRYVKMDEESRDPNNAAKYAFVNRLRSAAGEGVENLGLWLYETFGYEPGKRVYDAGEARAIGEVANEQVQKLVDAAPSQLGKDLVKVSDSVAQQLSYKIMTAPFSMFGSSVISDSVLSKMGGTEEALKAAGKAAHDFEGGIYTGAMAASSAADKYVECRAEGQGKLEASVRAMGTGVISYFSESLGGIGGSKSPLNGLEEKCAEHLISSILYNAFEEGGEEFVEYLGDYLLDGAVDLAAHGEWQQEWDWAEVIENAKIGAMAGGLFGGYRKLGDIKEFIDRKIDAANAAKLEKAAAEYYDYMKNAYRLMSDPNLREIAERQIGDTTIPAATRMNRSETGAMDFGNVFPKRAGEVSFEQMYGVKTPDESKNGSFAEWNESNRKQAAIDGEKVNSLPLKERLTMIINNTFPKTLPHVKLGDMPATIKATIGIDSDAPLVMSERKAYEVMASKGKDKNTAFKKGVNWHNLGVDGLEKVVAALDNPIRAVKQGNGRYGFVVEIERGKKPYYAVVEIEAEGNYRGKMEKTNVVVSAFGTSLNYVENQMAKGTELEIKKESASQVTHGRQLPYGVNETDSNGDVPSPNDSITDTSENFKGESESSAAETQQKASGMVSFEQMYGVKPDAQRKNGSGESFEEWAARTDAEKKKAAEAAENAVEGNRRNVDYKNKEERSSIQRETHDRMVSEGKVIDITKSVKDKSESFPNLRSMKKSERLPIIKQKMVELKNTLREQLNKLKVNSFEFDIKGNTIEARLYDTGIREVLEKLTQEKAGMISLSKEIFESAEYLYSTQDKSGDTNIEAWDYFYVPIKIGDETSGVRIATRKPVSSKESQIYNWGIKKDTSLGGVRHTPFGSNPNGTSSDVSAKNIPQNGSSVNTSSKKSSIGTQSLEEYLGERGLSSPVSNYNIDKTRIPHGETQRQRDARIKAGVKAENEYSEKRRAAIEEYNAKVEKGEIRVPSAIEKTIKKAQGYLDNPSVAAARRMAEKRGYDWISGEKLDTERQAYTLSYLDENGKELSETFTTRGEAEERAATLSENADYDTKALVTATMPQSAAETQRNSESAAGTQRIETEEEARLRTLYETEPTGKYAGTEAGESKAELDEKVKEAKENAVGDDELKEKPKTEKQKILKRRIEKAGLDMTVEEIVGFAEGLGRIKGFFGSERKDFARIFDDVSEGSRTIRNDLHKLLEVPHRQAQARYTEGYKKAVKGMSDKFSELGIKAGSKESAAVQRIGEHAYQIDSKGNTAEYTYEMLKRDFPDSWEKIAEAAKFTRNIYDDYLKKLNAMYESIYPQTVEKAEERCSKLNAEAQRMSDYKDSLNEVKKALRENVDKKKAALAKSKDGTQKKADLKRQIATLEARMKAVDSKMAAADSRAFAAKLKSELIKSQIENGEILKNKQIKPRQDYFRHFQELNSNFAELTDIFTNDQNISPGLIGVSAETKPRTMWSSIAQARAKTHAYTEDAVGGLLKYAQTAETLLAYNPLISRYRDISAAIRTAAVMADEKVSGTGTNASRFAAYLDDWTNNIAGKSYVLDRYFERAGTNGRAILKAFEKINGIVKKGSLLHNVMSSAKQISNLPYASAYIPNPKDWISGAIASAESQFGKTETANALREARSQSSFMNERYLDNSIDKLTRAIMNDGIKEKNERLGAAMLGALDRVAAEYIWNTAYGYYLKNSGKADKKMGRDYDSAIDYADDITRRTVAGRGRGETALVQTSKLMGLVAPFQVEVNNTANLMAEQIGKRNAAGLIAVEINVYLMNSLLEAVLGDRPIGFDYISVVEDMLREAFGGGDDDDDEKKKPEAKNIAKNFAARFAGETLSSLPMGAQIAQIITAGDEKLAQKLFSEDRDPTRYGTGNIGVSGAVKAGQFVWDLFGGKYSVGSNEERWRMALDAADAIAPIVSPFGIGGRQLARTLRGAHSMVEGGVYGYDSEGKRYLKYAQGNGAADWAKALLMGQYATDAGREYVDGGFKTLSVKETQLMEIADGMGIPKELFYDTALGLKKAGSRNEEKQKWLYNNDKLTADQKRIIDALYFGNGDEAVSASRKEADLAGASTNKNNFYDILSGKLSSRRDYSGSYAFENSGYDGKTQGQIRKAGESGISRKQLLEVIGGTKNKKLPERMEKIYSSEGLTPEQQDKLGDIVLGDDGKTRRESYAAADIPISDRLLVEGILGDYNEQKKLTGDEEKDELKKKEFITGELMKAGKSEFEAYRLYKVQGGKWINNTAELDKAEQKKAAAAQKQYKLSESEYVTIKNYSGLAEGKKDKYGNTVSGSEKEDCIKNLAKLLNCSREEAERKYIIANECVYSVEKLTSSKRDKLLEGKKYGWTDEKWLEAENAIKLAGASKKDEKIKALRDAGFSATEAAGFYNLNAGNDYYSAEAAGTPYGLEAKQYDKTKYYSKKTGKSEKEVAGYYKAIKGLRKKVDIIAALEAAGLSSSEANEFYNLRQGRDSGYKTYKNGG